MNPLDLESTLGHKILIAGLQEAGKTAIKRVFFLKQQAVDVDNLKATIDYERMQTKINDVPLTVVDLGGQRIFIKRFLNSFSPFIFNNVKILIFVIDVSVRSTRNNAVQYFSSAMEKLNEFSRNADVYVFLHKNDLTRHLPNYESVHNQLKEQFQLESNQKLTFFRTTIFDPNTVINAFGRMFEMSIPAAAKGKLVEGRVVSSGEEFAKKFAVREEEEMETCPFCNVNLFRTPEGLECNICGHKPRKRLVIQDEQPQTQSKVSVEELQNQLNKVRVSENEQEIPTNPVVSEELIEQQKIYEQQQERERQRIADTKRYISQVQKEQAQDSTHNSLINYGFTNEEVEKIQNSEYNEFFTFSLNFGLSLDLLRNVLTKYIPKIIPSNLKLSNSNLFGILSTFKSGIIKEDEILKLLYFNQEFPDLTVEELIWNNFPNIFDESPKTTVVEELEKESLDEDILLLSFKENIGLKFIPRNYNLNLIFYKGKRKIDQTTIPYEISEKDLKYLLIFEVKLPVKENLQEFVEKTVEIILNELVLIKPEEVEVEPKVTETKLISDSGVFVENQNIDYDINIENSVFELSFIKQGRNFGTINGPLTITAPVLFQEIKNKTLISTLIDEDDLMFASLELYNKFEKLIKK
ncbi:MAG: ADP-ribosylation factor-like protein [Candidatus Hodarchaeales archaeon]